MTYEEKKKLIEAADLLKEHCNKKLKGYEECDCPFATADICGIVGTCPKSWSIPLVIRWTPEDVALAKALKEVGATEIYGTTSHLRMWKNENMSGYLPVLSFRNIEDMEVVRIDDIIKEAEE